MKTYKEWESSGKSLTNYLTEPCEIEERLHFFIGECITPHYLGEGIVQGGDCEKQDISYGDKNKLVRFYMTSSHVNGKYFYLGILPEFCQ